MTNERTNEVCFIGRVLLDCQAADCVPYCRACRPGVIALDDSPTYLGPFSGDYQV